MELFDLKNGDRDSPGVCNVSEIGQRPKS